MMFSKTNKMYFSLTISLHFAMVCLTILNLLYEESNSLTCIIILILLICIISLYKTITCNHDVIKKYSSDYTNGITTFGDCLVNTNSRYREIHIDNIIQREYYCINCELYRSKNIYHCNYCNKCILYHDHHCIWINNCIGQNNYRFFIYTINGHLLILIYNLIICRNYILFYFLFNFSILVGFLSVYFWILLIYGITSREAVQNKIFGTKILGKWTKLNFNFKRAFEYIKR